MSEDAPLGLVVMNGLDEELTQRRLNTRVVFIAYVDTMFGPEQVTVKNPQRVSLLYAPISRSYTASVTEDTPVPEPRACRVVEHIVRRSQGIILD